MKTIVFDFDGTILDSTLRLYNLFIDITKYYELTYEKYWLLKRSGISNINILQSFEKPNLAIDEFQSIWMSKIETDYYLKMDILYPNVKESLSAMLETGNKLVLCTARQNHSEVEGQLKKFQIDDYFGDILVTEQKNSKTGLFISKLGKTNVDFVIGDTPNDIEFAKNINAKSISITHGFIDRETLSRYEPDFLVTNFNELMNLIRPYDSISQL
jgi:phosphoglycolate phosphatase